MKLALPLGMALLAWLAPAMAFRDDLATTRESCSPTYSDVSLELRLECRLQQYELGCEGDLLAGHDLDQAMAGTAYPFRFQRAVQRQRAARGDERSFCALGTADRRKVMAEALAPLRVRSESGKEWLMRRLRGATGEVDTNAMASALEMRHDLTVGLGAKRAGLPAIPSGWTNLTGFTQSSGRVNHLLIHPTTPNTMWLGSDGGGIWKTVDGGVTWNRINDFLGSLSISTLVMDPGNPGILYAGTNPSGSHGYFPFGVLKSTDGGNTWSQLVQTSPAANPDWAAVTRLAIHPGNGSILLAATNGGAYATADGGATWSKVAGISTAATFVAFHPANGNIRAIAYNDGTLRYTTTGDLVGAGAATATVLAGGRFMKFAYAPSDTNRVYALITDAGTGNTKFYRSTTGGSAWGDLTANISGLPHPSYTFGTYSFFYNQSYLSYTGNLWVDPVNPDRVAIAEGWAMFTPNASATPIARYSLCTGWTDFHAIVAHPAYNGTTNKIVFFMDDGGLYKVTDIDQLNDANGNCVGGVFSRLETGATVTQVYSVAGRGGNVILGAQDVAPRIHRGDAPNGDPATKWRFTQRPVGDPVCSGCSWIGDGATAAASRANPAVLYGSRQFLDAFRSTDGGLTATSLVNGSAVNEGRGIASPNFKSAFIAPFVLDPSNSSRLYLGGQSLWRTDNADTGNPPTFASIRAPQVESLCGGGTFGIDTIAVAPGDPNVVWISYECSGRLFKTANALASPPTWVEVTTFPTVGSANFRSKSSIMIDRNNANVVWVGTGSYAANPLYRTTDGGASTGGWTTVSGLPSAPVNALLQHPLQANWLYAGTGVGLFASADGGATWSTTNEGPANVSVMSLAWYSEAAASAELLVGTFGRGVFRATAGPTVPDAPPAPTAAGGNAQATVTIGAPASDGGSAITGYTVASTPAGGVDANAGGLPTPRIITGLANGTLYTFTVTASNAIGTSAASSPSNAVTPTAVSSGLGVNPSSIAFGGQSMGTTSASRTITVTNLGGATLTISAVSVSSSQVAQTNNCTSVAPSATCTITLTFSPAAVAGALNSTASVMGTLTITSNGTGSPHTVSLTGTAEKSLVTHYYRAILNRAPDGPGKAFWESEAARLSALGVNINETWFVMAGYFFNGTEYLAANKTNEQFVADLYNTFFNRPPDAGGQGYWVSQIVAGLPREVVLFSFMFSNEFRTFTQGIFGNTAARPEVDMVVDFFRGLLNRFPETAAFNYWLGRIRTAQCQGAGPVYGAVGEISAAFMFNPEYDNRARNNTQFVTDMYYSFLRRGGDVTGVQFWINELNSGRRARNDVRVLGFLNSPEFGARVQAVIGAGCAP